ncbi:MAG: DUF3841 domain-containing protein [Bacillota bacterium]|nr:DUF3841 domain-containing protein [Bacillota bacterium]
MENITLWTRQDKKILESFKNGIYRCKEEYINEKMENFSDYYKKIYKWYSKKAEKIVPKPDNDIEYPVWVSPDEDMQLRPNSESIILKLSVPKNKVVITDSEKWGYVVNFLYLPKGEEDYKEHKKLLKKYNINDPTEIIMGNFYPQLKRKVEKSWDRLFEDYSISETRQGTIWEIHRNDIVEIIEEN